MILLAADWATISSLATAGGTLVLAVATFASVRSSSRAARIAEAALQEQRRPLLAPSRLGDPKQKIMFMERHWVSASGGRGAVEHVNGVVYFVISLRNVGSGIAVCQGWTATSFSAHSPRNQPTHSLLESFRPQSRDLYIPAGDIGMWQGALRDPDDPVRAGIIEAIDTGQDVFIELLYSDQVGLQRTISRFLLVPAGDEWLASTNRHWYLDWDGPRPETLTRQAAELILREQDALTRRTQETDGGNEVPMRSEPDDAGAGVPERSGDEEPT